VLVLEHPKKVLARQILKHKVNVVSIDKGRLELNYKIDLLQ